MRNPEDSGAVIAEAKRVFVVCVTVIALIISGIIMTSCGGDRGGRDRGDRGGWFLPSGG